eukprot:8835512-Pyramimonas_sp.AAC.2
MRGVDSKADTVDTTLNIMVRIIIYSALDVIMVLFLVVCPSFLSRKPNMQPATGVSKEDLHSIREELKSLGLWTEPPTPAVDDVGSKE